jgi:hypothetical protein
MLRLLENVKGFNTFRPVDRFEHVNGSQQDLYFQIIQVPADASPGDDLQRWLPSSGATLRFTFDNIDQAGVITRSGIMVYPTDDRSIFKVTLLSTESISGSVTAVLTDGGLSETLLLDGRLIASDADSGRFFC